MGKFLLKMAVLLKGNDSRGHFLLENPSLINFQIGNERKREFRAAEMRLYLHKEFRAAGIRFLSTQRIGGGDLEENGHFSQGFHDFS